MLRRVVIDPNVLVSAAITSGGAPAAVVDLVDAGVLTPIVSPRLLAELAGVLRRDKFRSYLTVEQADAFVTELARLAEVFNDSDDLPRVSPDPDDDYLFELARRSGADALVSGDADVLAVEIPELDLLTPRQLLDQTTNRRDLG